MIDLKKLIHNEKTTSPLIDDLPFDILNMDMDKESRFGLEVLMVELDAMVLFLAP